jgi:hypothetical protein
MHMNKMGKERIALERAKTVANILLKREKVISLQWKNAQGDSPIEENVQWKNAKGDSVGDSPTEGNIPLQKDLKVTPSIATNVEAPLEVTAQDSVSDSTTEGNIPLQKDLDVTPSITTNVEAPLEVTAREEPRPRTSKRQKKPPTTKSENFLW